MRGTKRLNRHNAPKRTLTGEQVTGKITEKYIKKKKKEQNQPRKHSYRLTQNREQAITPKGYKYKIGNSS